MTACRKPVVLGGTPLFSQMLDVVGPALPPLEAIAGRISDALATGRLTNNGVYVRQFEQACSEYLGVPHVVAFANGTLSLMMLLKGLGLRGKAVLPSFTYIASAHVLEWVGLQPVWADIDPDSYCITRETVEAVLDDDVSVIMAVPVFGVPCDVEGLQTLADARGIRLIYDSAHAFGSAVRGRNVGGFGAGESFSLHATKALPTGEGGLVSTHDADLAEWLRASRVFGDYGDHDTRFAGLNAKMTEFAALLGLEGLAGYPAMLEKRRLVARAYRDGLADLPGLRFQALAEGCDSTYQNVSVVVDSEAFGLTRDELCAALDADNVMARKYFWPPAHCHAAYRTAAVEETRLPVTMAVSSSILCLPMHPAKPIDVTLRVVEAVRDIWSHREAVRQAV